MNLRWDILSRYRSELMGIAILWIMAFHTVELKHNRLPECMSDLYGVLFHGYLGVEIFLLLSGIGLYYALKKNDSLSHFYRKRLQRLLIPYLAISFCFFGYHDLLVSGNIEQFIKDISMYSFWVEGNRMVWFIALIIPLYVVYPGVFKVINSDHFLIKIGLLICAVYVGMVILKMTDLKAYVKIEIALTRIPIFLLGGAVGRLVYEKAPVRAWLKFFLLGIGIFALYAFGHKNFAVVSWKAYRAYFSVFSVAFAYWLAVWLSCISCESFNSLLRKVGGMSLELYLTHVAILHTLIKTSFYKESGNGLWPCLLVVVFGGLVISYILHYRLFPFIYRKMEREL